MTKLVEIYTVGFWISFGAGLLLFFFLLFLREFGEEKEPGESDAGALWFALPALLGAVVLAFAGAILWPVTALFYGFVARDILRRLRRMIRREKMREGKADRWPLSLAKDLPETPGIKFKKSGPQERATCPVCMEPIAGEVRVCPRCGTAHHKECWEFQKGCGMFGCEPD